MLQNKIRCPWLKSLVFIKYINVDEKYHTLNNTIILFECFFLAPSRTIFWLIEYIILGDSAIWSNHKTCTISSSISNNIHQITHYFMLSWLLKNFTETETFLECCQLDLDWLSRNMIEISIIGVSVKYAWVEVEYVKFTAYTVNKYR